MTMVSPKQLGVGDSDVTLSRRKSLRTRSSKRSAPKVTEVEEETKKKQKNINKKKKKTKTKLSEPLITRIWSDEDVLSILKGLVDYRGKTGLETKIDWDECYGFLGGSIVEKFSKDQVSRKIRKLKRKYFDQKEKIKQRNDRKFTRSIDSEAFRYSEMIWGENEAGVDKEMLYEPEEQLNDNAAVMEQQNSARLPQQSEGGEDTLKEKEQEANVGKEDGAAKKTENETNGGKENHDDDDEICAVRDAFDTVMSQGLTDYQKKVQLEKVRNIGDDKRRELSDGWKELCVEERRLNMKKHRFSAKLAEALNDGGNVFVRYSSRGFLKWPQEPCPLLDVDWEHGS